ncbi:MAG: hypothetical protein IJC72_00305 [Clostridia bacterium]|nr:hypothetical protein [Clostridia bacterium]MBQ4097724.1 hypothetical protein [Clostridia bacterium]
MAKFIELNLDYNYKTGSEFVHRVKFLRADEILSVDQVYDNKESRLRVYVSIKESGDDGSPEFFPVKETYEQIKEMLENA